MPEHKHKTSDYTALMLFITTVNNENSSLCLSNVYIYNHIFNNTTYFQFFYSNNSNKINENKN